MIKIRKIISGGQTGADRAAFDFALETGIEIGGFIPKGRRAEDGKIDAKYHNLVETATKNYSERTRLNVLNADATLIFSHGKLTKGSLLTKKYIEKYKKPFRHIDFTHSNFLELLEETLKWIVLNNFETINIAGARASNDHEIYSKTLNFLMKLFCNK